MNIARIFSDSSELAAPGGFSAPGNLPDTAGQIQQGGSGFPDFGFRELTA